MAVPPSTYQIDGPIPVPLLDIMGVVIGTDPRCFVNVPAREMRPSWAAYRIYPGTPTRIFAGDAAPWAMTVFLRFDNVAAMQATMGVS